MKTKTLLTIILLIISFILNAQILNVPESYASIQDGIDAATDGDTVLIADGTYYENISFNGKAITVASHYIIDGNALHILSTILDGSQTKNADTASVVRFVSGEDTTSILHGLAIKGGSGIESSVLGGSRIGGGIFCYNSGAKLVKNRIINNVITHGSITAGAGIGSYVETGDYWLVVEDNWIMNNTSSAIWSSARGGGLYASSNARVNDNTIQYNMCTSSEDAADGAGAEFESISEDDVWTIFFTNNDVQYNTCDGGSISFGGGLSVLDCDIFIEDNIFNNNMLIGNRGLGAAINLFPINFPVETYIKNNDFSTNEINVDNDAWGAAINISHPNEKVEIIDNHFSSNTATGTITYGTFSIYYYTANYPFVDTEFIVNGNTFSSNNVDHGAGICVYNASNIKVSNNLFSANYASTSDGGAMYFHQIFAKSSNHNGKGENQGIVISNNTFVDNEAGNRGGAIFNDYWASFSLATFNNIFWGNMAGEHGEDIFNASSDQILVANSNIDPINISGNWTGSENINENPILANDFVHLDSESPCIDQGTESIVFGDFTLNCTDLDIDKEERPDGNGVDIGADEYYPTLAAPVALDASEIGSGYFVAEWLKTEFAEGYNLDVAWDEDFVDMVNDYENLDVGDTNSITVSGLPDGYPYYYRLRAYNQSGSSLNSNVITVLTVYVEPITDNAKVLLQVHPNPFKYQTNIKFHLDKPSICKLKVYNSIGDEVETLFDMNMEKGPHNIQWNIVNLPNGIYHLRLSTGNNTLTTKVLHLR